MFLPEDEPPTASREEDLPGYTYRLRQPSIPRIFLFCLLMALVCPSEGCLPSWFRHEKKHPPAALEGKVPNETAEVLSKNGIRTELSQGTNYQQPEEEYEVEYVEEEEEDQPHLSGTYGTPSPIAHDPQLEEYRRAYMERECEGWCYSGGNCSVHVHPVTYAYIGKECRCPYNFMGARCEEHYVRTLWAPMKGDAIAERSRIIPKSQETSSLAAKGLGLARIQLNLSMSSVPVLSLFLIMGILAVGIAVFSYRRITKRHETARFTTWRSSPSLSTDSTTADSHLHRAGGQFKGRRPFSTKMPPRSETFRGTAPLLLEGGHFVLPKTAIGHQSGSGSKHQPASSCPREPPPVLLPRKNTLPSTG